MSHEPVELRSGSRSREKQLEYSNRKNYGLEPDEYIALFEKSGYTCYCCARGVTTGGKGFGAKGVGCVDAGTDGEALGILCRVCASWLGVVKYNLDTAREYLNSTAHLRVPT